MGEGECVYYLESSLTANEYLSQLKRTFCSPFLIYDERVCGIIIGPFFSVAYHSPHEWNRRITSECNRAWGYVKEVDGKASVTFMRGKGLLSPFWLVFCTLLWYAVLSLKFGHEPVLLSPGRHLFSSRAQGTDSCFNATTSMRPHPAPRPC